MNKYLFSDVRIRLIILETYSYDGVQRHKVKYYDCGMNVKITYGLRVILKLNHTPSQSAKLADYNVELIMIVFYYRVCATTSRR